MFNYKNMNVLHLFELLKNKIQILFNAIYLCITCKIIILIYLNEISPDIVPDSRLDHKLQTKEAKLLCAINNLMRLI